MKYSLHPGAETDLREAAEFYRQRAGTSLSRALLEEFDHASKYSSSTSKAWRTLAAQYSYARIETLSLFLDLQSF